MDMQTIGMYAGIGVVWASVTFWAYKKYKKVMADGKITLDEILEVVDEGIDVIQGAIGETEKLNELKKVDLIALCREKGLPVSGNKAELVKRLQG